MVISKKLFKIVDTLLGRNKQTTLPKYDSPLTMASVMYNFFIDKIDNIRAEFPLLEASLPCYSFLLDSIMPIVDGPPVLTGCAYVRSNKSTF